MLTRAAVTAGEFIGIDIIDHIIISPTGDSLSIRQDSPEIWEEAAKLSGRPV